MYKVVTKIIVARLQPYLDKLISPMQTAFVPGRKGIDNIIIAQEIMHSLGKKKGRTGYVALKIDLEKAYDKLEWNFIKDMLIRVSLSMDIIDVIMSCVSTVSTSILFNGKALDPIYPSRGIRQGARYLHTCSSCAWTILGSSLKRSVVGSLKASQSGPAVDRDTRECLLHFGVCVNAVSW